MLVPTVEMVLADVLVTLEIELPVALLVAGWKGGGGVIGRTGGGGDRKAPP